MKISALTAILLMALTGCASQTVKTDSAAPTASTETASKTEETEVAKNETKAKDGKTINRTCKKDLGSRLKRC